MTGEPARATPPTSPLGNRAAELAAAPPSVRLRELAFRAQLNLRVDLRGPAAAAVGEALGAPLPTRPNSAVRSGELTALWLGPDEWLVLAPVGRSQHLGNSLRLALGTEEGAVVDLSAHRTTVELSGPRAREVLAKGCSLDLHPTVFGPADCAQTLLARAPVLLLGRGGDPPSYWLLVAASFAAYVVDWCLDAAVEYASRL